MTDRKTDLLVLGAGPGGYVCAIRAAKLGVDTLVVEQGKPGGTCLNIGCIPSKAIIHAADEFYKACAFSSENVLGIHTSPPEINLTLTQDWKNSIVKNLNGGVSGLLKRAGANYLNGRARFLDGKTVEVFTDDGVVKVNASNIVIAAGSEPVEISSLPFGGDILSSTQALELIEVPETLVVVGGGYIGLEIGTAFSKLGSRVSIVESENRVLAQYDEALTTPVSKRLTDLNIEVIVNATAKGFSKGQLEVLLRDGKFRQIPASKVLVAVGRKPREGYGLEELSLTMDGNFIAINEKCQTSMLGVYAIGDVTGEPMLAHRAMAQGEVVADIIAGGKCGYDKQCMPAVCFTDPEIVTAGLSPSDASEQGLDVSVGQFPLHANGRAMTIERSDGFIRIVSQTNNGVVLGIQAVGPQVSELSAAFSLAIEMGARAEDIASTVHAHPTISEGLQEAALNVLGRGLHL